MIYVVGLTCIFREISLPSKEDPEKLDEGERKQDKKLDGQI